MLPTRGASWGQASSTFVSELMINRRGHSEPVRTCDRTDRDDSISQLFCELGCCCPIATIYQYRTMLEIGLRISNQLPGNRWTKPRLPRRRVCELAKYRAPPLEHPCSPQDTAFSSKADSTIGCFHRHPTPSTFSLRISYLFLRRPGVWVCIQGPSNTENCANDSQGVGHKNWRARGSCLAEAFRLCIVAFRSTDTSD
jgi:hypothetical protein